MRIVMLNIVDAALAFFSGVIATLFVDDLAPEITGKSGEIEPTIAECTKSIMRRISFR